MEAIKDLLASVRFQLSERIANPLTGAFAIAWSVANFRLLLVLFSDGDWQQKLTYIDRTLYPDWREWARLGLFWPLVVALLYVFVYPFVAHRIIQFHRTRQRELRELAIKVDGETPITKEEKSRLLLKIRQADLNWKKQVEDLQAENQALSEALARAQGEQGSGPATQMPEPSASSSDSPDRRRSRPSAMTIRKRLLKASSGEAQLLYERGIDERMARVLDLMSDYPAPFGVREVSTTLRAPTDEAQSVLTDMQALGILREYSGGLLVSALGHEVLQHVMDTRQYVPGRTAEFQSPGAPPAIGPYYQPKRKGSHHLFNLRGPNNEIVLTSERYASEASMQGGIAAVRQYAPYEAHYQRLTGSAGQPYFTLKAGDGEVIGTSEAYSSNAARDAAIEWVKKHAPTAPTKLS